MKQIYILFTLISSVAFSQIPANYYDSANGLTGYALKTELRNIISANYQQQSYNALMTAYVNTHSDVDVDSGKIYENDGTILDMYSENPTNPNSPTPSTNNDPYNFTHGNNQCGNQNSEGDCYNREHLIPASSYNDAYPMYSDIHHVIPTDGRVNNFRGTLPFGIVDTPNWTSQNGSKRGSSGISGYGGTMFEPIDEFKGDIARAILYFVTRYQDNVDTYNFDMFNGTEDQALEDWAVTMLLDWHYNIDPVDERERVRNQAAYAHQNNANPFVDHPEYANLIWNPTPDTEAPSNPTNLTATNPTSNSINLLWTASTDNIAVASYDIYVDGVNTYNTTNTAFVVTGLTADTEYCFTVTAKDAANNVSGLSNEACETTTNNNNTGGSNELFISEYVEGSSFNKAIEIANFTGAAVDLSNYSVRRNGNGGGTWDAGVTLSGTLANGDVYVIANGGIASPCLASNSSVIDLLVGQSNSPTNFNGDDPIGLFKDGVLIDMVGVEGDVDFGKNVTLIRKPTVSSPTATYNENEWNSLASNSCTDLGVHTQTLSIDTAKPKNAITIYPNPLRGNTLHISSSTATTTTIYNILGKVVKTSTNSEINVSGLNSGMYLVKIETENGTHTKKLIRQ